MSVFITIFQKPQVETHLRLGINTILRSILIIFNLYRTTLFSPYFFIATSCLVSIKKSVTLWKTFLGRLTTLAQMAEHWTVYRNKNFSNNAISSPTDSKWKCWNFWWMMFSFRHSLCGPCPVPAEMYKWNEPAYNLSSFKEKNSY